MSYSIPDEMCKSIAHTLDSFNNSKLRDELMGSEPLAPLIFTILTEQLKATAIISEQLEDLQEMANRMAGYGPR